MKPTNNGLKISITELRELLEKAEDEARYHNGESYLLIREDEIEQPCVYRECNSRFYRP